MTMDIKDILLRPIPDMSLGRQCKAKYRDYPIYRQGARNDEALVDIADYGIAGQSYYSRQNAAVGGLENTSAAILVRQSLAQKLADINYALQRSEEVAELMGGRVELYVEEGLRTREIQTVLYNKVFPDLIRKQYPSWNEEKVMTRRDELIAIPGTVDGSLAPHATGAAVDVTLRFV